MQIANGAMFQDENDGRRFLGLRKNIPHSTTGLPNEPKTKRGQIYVNSKTSSFFNFIRVGREVGRGGSGGRSVLIVSDCQ